MDVKGLTQPISTYLIQSDDSQIQEEKSADLETNIGKVILSLAENAFNDQAIAIRYTLKKLEWFKEKGFSISSKLSAKQVHKIVTELNVLSIQAEMEAELPSPTIDKKPEAFVLEDFSGLSEEELNQKAEELQLQLDEERLKKQQFAACIAYSDLLDQLSGGVPSNLIDKLSLCESFVQKLQGVKLEEIQKETENQKSLLQTNFNHLQQLLNCYRQSIHSFCSEQKIDFVSVDQEVLQFLVTAESITAEAFISEENFEKLILKPWQQKMDQELVQMQGRVQNQANHRVWQKLFDEIYQEIEIAAKNDSNMGELTEKEKQHTREMLAQLSAENQKEINFDQKPEIFNHNEIQPIKDAIRKIYSDLLNFFKVRRDNQEALNNLMVVYAQHLEQLAQDKYKVKPPFELYELHTAQLNDNINLPQIESPQFNQELEELKKKLWSPDIIGEWNKRVYTYSKVQALAKTPQAFIEKIWDKEIGADSSYKQFHIDKLVKQINQLAQSRKLDKEDIEQLEKDIIALRQTINQLELKDLRERLEKNPKVKPEVIETIMHDWVRMGVRIQYNLEVLTEAHKLKVIEAAEKGSEYREALMHIEEDLKEHRLSPHPIVIEKKYEQLKTLIKNFPEVNSQQKYQLILNKATVEQELIKRKFPRNAPRIENRVLELLGFNLLPEYLQPEYFQQLATVKLLKELAGSETLSAKTEDQLQEEIQESDRLERFNARGITEPDHIANITSFITAAEELEKQFIKILSDQLQRKFPVDFLAQLPATQNYLIKKRANLAKALAKEAVIDLIQKDKTYLLNTFKGSPDKFKPILCMMSADVLLKTYSELKEEFVKNFKERFEPSWNFYKKWHSNLKVSSIQGSTDTNEILGQGVCLAKCLRVGRYEQSHPDLPADQIKADVILPRDRFNQAKYMQASETIRASAPTQEEILTAKIAAPREIITGFGYAQIQWLVVPEEGKKPIDDIKDQFQNFYTSQFLRTQLEKSNGVVYINIDGEDETGGWGHALEARVDFQRNIFRFHDPNVGVIEWKLDPEDSPKEAISKISEYWADLINTIYPTTVRACMYQLL